MSRTPNEAVYDEKISPLMEQIIAVCHENHIPMVADFDLGLDEEEGNHLHCSTVIELEHEGPDGRLKNLAGIIYPPKRGVTMMTVKDGDGVVKSMTAFVD